MKATTAARWILFAAAATASCAAPLSPAPPPRATSAPASPRATDAAALFARFKEATGGARWDAVSAFTAHGTLTAGGLSGSLDTLEDTRTGRSVSRYALGSMQGAEGFDGTTGWEQDPGGEVSALDAADAREGSRTDAWMNARAYFFPLRGAALLSEVRTETLDGKRHLVVDAVPAGGKKVTLWFDATTSLLVRAASRRGQDTVSTAFDDYRDVAGVRVPFHVTTDRTDTAGRTDPRARTEISLDRVTSNATIDASAFAMPGMRSTAHIVDASGVTRVPFDLVNNHIYADATVDGARIRVIVDTGGVNLLTPAAAKRLGITGEGKLQGRGVGDEHVDVALAHTHEARLGGATLTAPVFYVLDLGPIAEGEGVPCDGLVGFEMFRRFRVTVDYAAHVLTLTDPAKFKAPEGAHVVPFTLADRIPVVEGTLDGLPVRLSVDTGSRSSLTMHSPFVREHDLGTRYAAGPDMVVGWGVGGPTRGRPARLGTLVLGDVPIRDLAGDLYTGDKGSFANPDLAGNLGSGALRRFTVTFDYDARKMYLVPNAEAGKPDGFDRSGMWLFQDGDAMKIVALVPGGPAAKAGLIEGDRIVKIGGERAASRKLADWRARLRDTAAGTRVAVSVARGGKEETVAIVLADLIPPHAAR